MLTHAHVVDDGRYFGKPKLIWLQVAVTGMVVFLLS